MKTNFSPLQGYIACFLLINLLQSCRGEFGNKTIIPIQEKETALIRINTQPISIPNNTQLLIGQEVTAQGSHTVTCYGESDILEAQVEVNVPQIFNKTYQGLEVAVEQGAELTKLPSLDGKAQQRRICIHLTQRNHQSAKLIVCKEIVLAGDTLGEKEHLEDKQELSRIDEEQIKSVKKIVKAKKN